MDKAEMRYYRTLDKSMVAGQNWERQPGSV